MYSTLVLCLAVLGSSIAAPGHIAKTVVLDKEADIPNTVGGSLGASASFGGFSAGAGLGGSADGGGLYAGAKSPQGSAQAGLGGGSSSSASASASAGAGGGAGAGAGATAGSAQGGGFFDKIFNIPISILQSVNTHLNANGGVRKRVYVAGGNGGAAAGGPAHAGASASAGASAGGDGTARADAGADASAVASGGGHASIPITALKSVNQFLNGK
ncbi:uncharacterized protein [Halyomorpha halys]|uniref:uncharacterized protein isoform X2 n=1 Tax=Halyomorpha halys TaxID=286706 RepID=UPI0034D2A0DF